MKTKPRKLSQVLACIVLLFPFCIVVILLGLDIFLTSHIVYHLPNWLIASQIALLCLGLPLAMLYLLQRYITHPLEVIRKRLRSPSAKVAPWPRSTVREIDAIVYEVNHLRKRLGEEEELRKNLISDTSHELNTPLSSLLAELAAAKDGLYTLDKEHIQGLYQTTERLIAIVAQLDAYAKARVPLQEPSEDIHPNELCKRSIQALDHLLSENGFTTSISIPEDYILRAHAKAFEQILHNLIYNAVLHSGGNHILMSMPTPHTFVFEDNGHGVPAADLAHLFERFYRSSPSKQESSGMGLGLSIVKELAEREGWHVTVQNADPGLTFTFTDL